ncbi:MAG: 16S rRNA (guanine(527)-N(7))-methyltransferase RsmG [Coriobacteriales bacterium]|nr:16S rRNA (guanine(527)-N(7))-methyltransferase RsmG [Coriobacteriales bacterium]
MAHEKQALIEEHLRLVLRANQRINLTRITDWQKALCLHVEDSLAGLKELAQAPEGSFADIGSGAGYPGIPLAIESGRSAALIESVQKKADILEDIVSTLSLGQQIRVLAKRAEAVAREGERFSALVVRAVSSLPVLMELAQPLLKPEGILIAYKAELNAEELQKARSLEALLGMNLVDVRNILLSDESTKRSIITVCKQGEAQIALPRRDGVAQKRPLWQQQSKGAST